MPAKNVERITISLPPPTASRLRRYAVEAHGGNVSAAVAELVRWTPNVSQSQGGRKPEQATPLDLT